MSRAERIKQLDLLVCGLMLLCPDRSSAAAHVLGGALSELIGQFLDDEHQAGFDVGLIVGKTAPAVSADERAAQCRRDLEQAENAMLDTLPPGVLH